MKSWVLDLLTCPHCAAARALEVFSSKTSGDKFIEGSLSCQSCAREYPIFNGIPRFVEPDENYSENFGYQ